MTIHCKKLNAKKVSPNSPEVTHRHFVLKTSCLFSLIFYFFFFFLLWCTYNVQYFNFHELKHFCSPSSVINLTSRSQPVFDCGAKKTTMCWPTYRNALCSLLSKCLLAVMDCLHYFLKVVLTVMYIVSYFPFHKSQFSSIKHVINDKITGDKDVWTVSYSWQTIASISTVGFSSFPCCLVGTPSRLLHTYSDVQSIRWHKDQSHAISRLEQETDLSVQFPKCKGHQRSGLRKHWIRWKLWVLLPLDTKSYKYFP